MGRVSKHKRIKSHDPFYRGPRRDRRGMVDLCPGNDEQPVPKSLIRLMKRAESIKKTKNKKRRSDEGVQEAKGSAVETGTLEHRPGAGEGSREREGKEAGEGPMFSKRKGESLKSYLERVDMEANARIMETFRKNRKPSERRKRRLEERWKKAVARRKRLSQDRSGDMELRDEVKFGEVVQAPPELKAKPRGSKHSSFSSPKPLLLQQKMSASPKQPQKSKRLASRQQVAGLKRKHDLELEREHVISVYRQKKAATHATLEC